MSSNNYLYQTNCNKYILCWNAALYVYENLVDLCLCRNKHVENIVATEQTSRTQLALIYPEKIIVIEF